MAGDTTKIIVVQQAEGGDALQAGTVVDEGAAAGGAAAPAHGATTAEGGEAKVVFPPFNPETFGSQILWFALTFAILWVVMSRLALPRIGGILESRRIRIEGDLKEAERLRVETERAMAAYEQALAEARKNAHNIAEETRASIKQDLDGKRTKVEADLSQKVATAEARIQKTKTDALASVDEIAAETAVALVGQLVGTVTPAAARAAVASVVKG